jgi:hypothetical protein
VEITVGVWWAVVVDHNIDTFDINATTKDVGCDEDTLFKGLEGSVTIYAAARI